MTRLLRASLVFVFLLGALLALVNGAAARDAKDGRPEVRAAGICGAGATSKLRLRSRDGRIEFEFEVDHNRAGVVWRIAIVHERRVAWKGTARTAGPSGSFTLQSRLPNLVGPDTVTARAWSTTGVTCRATAILAATH